MPRVLNRKETSIEAIKLLKQLVAEETGVTTENIAIEKDQNGAPFLTISGVHAYCSITHKHNFIAVAFSKTRPVGVDAENLSSQKDYSNIREQYANGFFQGIKTKEDFFYRWTLAEAYTKASGDPLLKILELNYKQEKPEAFYLTVDAFLICACSNTLNTPYSPRVYYLPAE